MNKSAIVEKLSTAQSKRILKKTFIISCFALIILSAVYFTFLYPDLGLILLVALVAVTNEIDDWVKKLLGHNAKKALMIILAISIAGGSFVNYFANTNRTKFLQGTCDLQTKTSNSEWNLIWGAGPSQFTAANPADMQFGRDPIDFSLKDGHVVIDATVRDYQGNILGYISGGTFHTQAPGVEFNCDSKAVEVKDAAGNVVFQLQLNDPNIILDGVFYISPNQVECLLPHQILANYPNIPNACSLNPIFKYPADENQGVRV